MVKVSVIVPIYNTEQYLKRSIDTLVNQTLEEIEIILVNDASPDNSIKIMREYEKKYPEKIIVIDSKENLKAGGARNLGIDIAKGEYIGFVDSDDWVELDMFEKLYNKAKENNADIVDCNYILASGIGEILSEKTSNLTSQAGELNLEQMKSVILRTGRFSTKIYKKEMLDKFNIRFPEGIFYEDNEFVPVALVHSKYLDKVNENLYYYYKKNETSITSRQDSYHHFDRLITAENFLNYTKKISIYEKYKDEIDFTFIRLYYTNTIGMVIRNFQQIPIEKLKEIRQYIISNYPDYRKNKYFKERTPKRSRIITKLNDINPRLVVLLSKILYR